MTKHVPCLVFLFLIIVLFLLFGGYYTYKYRKDTILTSCFAIGGKCLEVEYCDKVHQYYKHVTTCIHKRKVCCMPSAQPIQNNEDDRDLMQLLE